MKDKLSIYEFGRKLLETKDLDPVYILLHRAEDYFNTDDLQAWLVAYWCFYHVGTASWILDEELAGSGHSYWEGMMEAAKSKDYPRSAERRHFRGENARKSVAWLESYGLDSLFTPLVNQKGPPIPLSYVMKYVGTWNGFGPWISFKVADMLERLGLAKVKFDDSAMFLFNSPREGASLLWSIEFIDGSTPFPDKEDPRFNSKFPVGQWAIDRILDDLGDFDAPPRYERKINAQEAETILCKWNSYMGGHYEIGEDIYACRRALLRFSKSRSAQVLLRAGKKADLWP